MKQASVKDQFIALCLCLIPILDPYILLAVGSFDIHVVLVLLGIVACFGIVQKRKLFISKSLFALLLMMLLLSFVAKMTGIPKIDLGTAFRSWCFFGIYTCIFSCVVMQCKLELFEKWVIRVGAFASVLLFVQYVAVSQGYNFWNGKIPFLSLSEYDGWAALVDVTGAVRVHSVFQEPAYAGIYLIPILAVALQKKKWWAVLLFTVAILTSTSSLAIGAMAIVYVMYFIRLVKQDHSVAAVRKYLIVAGLVIAGGASLFVLFPSMREGVAYTVNKIARIIPDLFNERMGSTRLRLAGNIALFKQYPFINKLVGVGVNQYGNVFADQIQYSYSNTFVTIILNHGIIGAIVFLLVCANWFVKSKGFSKIYPVFFLFVMCTDLMLFNWYFFYLIVWVCYGLNVGSNVKNEFMSISLEQCVKKIRSLCEFVKGKLDKAGKNEENLNGR